MNDITIVIPVYNTCRNYLNACFSSILNQTELPREVIFINDGSTEEETNYALSTFQTDYPNLVRVVNQENAGLSGAMNRGIAEVRTPWFMKLDSDDSLKPLAIQKINRLVKIDAYDVIGVQIEMFGAIRGLRTSHPPEITLDYARSDTSYWLLNHTGVTIRKKTIIKAGGYAENRRGLAEDYELWVNMLLAGAKIVNLPEVLVLYRSSHTGLASRATVDNVGFLARTRNKLFWDCR
jgi:glycosyltransferase involved in cell wall biosynthesis